MLTLKMKKVGLIGDEKRGKILSGHELVKDFIKEDVGGDICSIEYDVLVDYGYPIDKRGRVFIRYGFHIIYLFL